MSTSSHLLKRLFNIRYPIVQAPMAGAGITTAELVSAVCGAGALGFLASGYQSADLLRRQIDAVKRARSVFGVNVFVGERVRACVRRKQESLVRLERELGVVGGGGGGEHVTVDLDEEIEKKIDLCIESKVPIVSFTFGLPEKRLIDGLRSVGGAYVIATACSVGEALEYERAGVDAVVLQGSEAGGHRGSSASYETSDEIGLLALLQEAKRSSLKIPYIAAGGVCTGEAMLACRVLGAQAVQIGTGFLLTKECGASNAYKARLRASKSEHTVITHVISGKKARGVRNRLIDELSTDETRIEPYPIQNSLTKDLRSYASQHSLPDYQSLWCGQGIGAALHHEHEITAEKFIQKLVIEYEEAIKGGGGGVWLKT